MCSVSKVARRGIEEKKEMQDCPEVGGKAHPTLYARSINWERKTKKKKIGPRHCSRYVLHVGFDPGENAEARKSDDACLKKVGAW